MVVTCLSAGHNPLLHNGKCRHPAALLPGPIHRCSASQGQPLQPAARPVHGTQTSSQRLYACDHTVHTHLNEDDVHVTNCSSDLSLSVVCLFALCVLGRWGMGGGGVVSNQDRFCCVCDGVTSVSTSRSAPCLHSPLLCFQFL